MKKKYHVIRTDKTSLGRFSIRLDTVWENGREYPYSYVEIKDSVAVLACYEQKFIWIRQYRHSAGDYFWEIPGGAVEEGETPDAAARRELFEETGYMAESLNAMGIFYPSAGSSNEKCFLYYAQCDKSEKQKLEPLEYLTVELMSTIEIEMKIMKGEIVHSMALVAWLKYRLTEWYADKTSET